MSSTIVTSIKIDNDGNFSGNGGANNVRPFYTCPFHYDDKERFMYDLLSDCVKIDRVKSKLGDKIKEAVKIVEQKHLEKYGELQENYSLGIKSINPFSLYQIGGVYFQNKDGHTAPREIDYSIYSEKYRDQIKMEYNIYCHKWSEYVEFYKELLTIFFNHINTN